MTDPRQQDAEYLKLLTIFHYVVAGMMALWGSFPIIHFLVGLALLFGNFEERQPTDLPWRSSACFSPSLLAPP
jgi:hypothetical protein